MKSAQHCLYNSGIKVDILDTCGAMICSYFGIAFLLFFIKIENAVYTSCQNSTLLFINGLIFDIMNTQNNQSLEFEWKPMLAPLRSVNDQRFSWLHNVFLKLFQDWLSSVQKCQGNFERDAGQKMFILSALQIRAANFQPLTAHIYHVTIIVTGWFSRVSFLLLFPRNFFEQSWICFLGI